MLSYSFKGVYVLEMMIISFWVRRQSTSNAKNAWGYLAQMRSESLQSLTKFNCFCGKENANVKEWI